MAQAAVLRVAALTQVAAAAAAVQVILLALAERGELLLAVQAAQVPLEGQRQAALEALLLLMTERQAARSAPRAVALEAAFAED